jgi:hypothetical protein
MAGSEWKVFKKWSEWEKREETRGSVKDLKVCRITNICKYAKRLLKPSCPSSPMDVTINNRWPICMRFDFDEFNDNLTGHLIFSLDRIIVVKNSCRWRPWQLPYIRLVLTVRRLHYLATQCIYVFLHILKSNSDYFHIHHSPTGLSDRNTVSSARYDLGLYMYM